MDMYYKFNGLIYLFHFIFCYFVYCFCIIYLFALLFVHTSLFLTKVCLSSANTFSLINYLNIKLPCLYITFTFSILFCFVVEDIQIHC